MDDLPHPVRAVLFDRDGTIVHDVPYNGDPDRVDPVEHAAELVASLRAAGIRTGVVTNQSGIARGIVTREQVDAVNTRVDETIGPFDVWEICPHGPEDGCPCRKPAPGMVLQAAFRLGLDPRTVVVIGDIGADMGAAAAAGATGILVPTPVTRQDEVDAAPVVVRDLAAAVALVLARNGRSGGADGRDDSDGSDGPDGAVRADAAERAGRTGSGPAEPQR